MIPANMQKGPGTAFEAIPKGSSALYSFLVFSSLQQFSFSNCSNSKGHLVVLRGTEMPRLDGAGGQSDQFQTAYFPWNMLTELTSFI